DANLAECTPITTRLFGKSRSSFFNSGKMCMQLMQQYVQKSSRTNLPFKSVLVSGFVLSQVICFENSGTGNRRGNGFSSLGPGGAAAAVGASGSFFETLFSSPA